MTATEPRARRDFPFVAQRKARDCAFACLRMILRFHGGDQDFTSSRFASCLSRDGMTVLTLTRIAEQLGLRCSVLQGTLEEFTSEVALPCIIVWQQNHFMVVYRVTEDTIFIANPARGFEELSHEEFRDGWTLPHRGNDGIVLTLTPGDELAVDDRAVDAASGHPVAL